MFVFLRTILAAFIFAVLLLTKTVWAAQATDTLPTFQQFPVEVYRGPVAQLQWDDEILLEECGHLNGMLELNRGEAFRAYRETASDARYPYRFGGHYVVLSLQCEEDLDLLFDVRTGQFSGILPESVTGRLFRPDSSLLILNAAVPAVEEYGRYYDNATFFLVLSDGYFRLIAQKPWPELPGADQTSLSRLISKTPLGPLSPTGTKSGSIENILSALPPRLRNF